MPFPSLRFELWMHNFDTINQSNILFGLYYFNLDKLTRLIFMPNIRMTPRRCSVRLIFIFTFWLDFPLLFRSIAFLWHNQYNVDMIYIKPLFYLFQYLYGNQIMFQKSLLNAFLNIVPFTESYSIYHYESECTGQQYMYLYWNDWKIKSEHRSFSY